MKPSLQDRVILVIGGTTGIGWSAARAIINAGAKAMVLGPSSEDIDKARSRCEGDSISEQSDRLDWCAGDASDSATAVAAVQATVGRFGHLDGLVHVAGASGRAHGDGPLHTVPDDGWQWTLHTNLDSVAYSNRAAIQYWLQQDRSGAIVNMGSVLADRPARHFFATHAYATAKAALVGLTESLANYYAPHNIRCNLVAPGLIETPMSQRAMQDQQIVEYVRRRQPLDGGRPGKPEDVAGAIVFLLSDQSDFITGQTLRVDGGWSVSEGGSP